MEADVVFSDDGGFAVCGSFGGWAGGGVGGHLEAFGGLCAFIGAGEGFFDSEDFVESGFDAFESSVHWEVEEFDDGVISEAVDDEAWECVAFGVDEAVGVGGGFERFAEVGGECEALVEEGFVDGGGVEGEHAEADGGLGGEES